MSGVISLLGGATRTLVAAEGLPNSVLFFPFGGFFAICLS